MPSENIMYSEKYFDDKYEYRHVILPLDIARNVPKAHLMTETEWRNLGVQQSPGWVHYMNHSPGIKKGIENVPVKQRFAMDTKFQKSDVTRAVI